MGEALGDLVAAGHSLREILDLRQPGFPYRGWSKPQFELFLRAARRLEERRQKNLLSAVHLGVAAVYGKKAGAQFDRAMRELGRDRDA